MTAVCAAARAVPKTAREDAEVVSPSFRNLQSPSWRRSGGDLTFASAPQCVRDGPWLLSGLQQDLKGAGMTSDHHYFRQAAPSRAMHLAAVVRGGGGGGTLRKHKPGRDESISRSNRRPPAGGTDCKYIAE